MSVHPVHLPFARLPLVDRLRKAPGPHGLHLLPLQVPYSLTEVLVGLVALLNSRLGKLHQVLQFLVVVL